MSFFPEKLEECSSKKTVESERKEVLGCAGNGYVLAVEMPGYRTPRITFSCRKHESSHLR